MITFNHPQKNYLGEFTEQYNSHCNPIDTFDGPDKIKSQQLLFVITTPVLVNTIQILLDKLIKQTLARLQKLALRIIWSEVCLLKYILRKIILSMKCPRFSVT